MDNNFKYLPQLIVAYDGNDKFANLIHVAKADRNSNYFCPCCGGTVKPRALESTKKQSHYCHITGKCTKESQLHFFCKNWLFETGSKFYIKKELLEVERIEIEKTWNTPFGDYRPDITVYTASNKIIFFEMFFANKKTGDDYFCKWDYLGNDVVEVNIKEYLCKIDKDTIPVFDYLYHDGKCYNKTYKKKDIYSNTIAKIKNNLTRQNVLDYKMRIEKLDWFWIQIQSNASKENILKSVACMEYDDMVSCYDIVKRKNCVSYLKNDILNVINQSVIKKVRKQLDLPYDKNVFFDLEKRQGRTYEMGIVLDFKTEHISFHKIYIHCTDEWHFKRFNVFPKVVFKSSILTENEIKIPAKKIKELNQIFKNTVAYRDELKAFEEKLCEFENNGYKIYANNNCYTILKINENNMYDLILDKFSIDMLDINQIKKAVKNKEIEIAEKAFVVKIKNDEHYSEMIDELRNYHGIKSNVEIRYNTGYLGKNGCGIYLYLWLYGRKICYKKIEPIEAEFIRIIKQYKSEIDLFAEKYQCVFAIIDKINNYKNKLWNAKFDINYNHDNYTPYICISTNIQDYWNITETLDLKTNNIYNYEKIKKQVTTRMRRILKDIEKRYCCKIIWTQEETHA